MNTLLDHYRLELSCCRRSALWCAVVFVLSGLALIAVQGQGVLLPVYDEGTGQAALSRCPKGREPQLWLIVNPNSGPGSSRDAGMNRVLGRANAMRVKVLFYVDLVAFPGDGLNAPSSKQHVKTPKELLNERSLYSKWYGSLKWDGWFFDDVRAGMGESFLCIANWPGTKVLNPGSAFTPPSSLASALVVISEQANAWPRALTSWEKSHRAQCAVMGLKVSADSLPAFLTSTAGMALRYASPLDDQWQHGQSAYTTLTPYFGRLLTQLK